MSNGLVARLRQQAAETSFSGVVTVRKNGLRHCEAFGFRDRPNRAPNTPETRFGTASMTKGFTAVGIAKLVERGALDFETPANSVIGTRLKNLHGDITVKNLLDHSSGIGDYLDEAEIDDIERFELAIPPHRLMSPLDYIPLIEAKPQKFEPGARFSYSNSGYAVLGMIIELVSGEPYQDFIDSRIFGPAGMARSGFFRSDGLPENTAIGYLGDGESWQTNLFKLPIRGAGDGGAFTTAADMERFWAALVRGELIGTDLVAQLLTPRLPGGQKGQWYGLGFWLNEDGSSAALIGGDAGVSCISLISRSDLTGYTVLSNSTSGAWPIVRLLDAQR